MSEQVKAKDNKVLVKCVSVKGGDLPNGFQVYVNLEFDYTGISIEDLQGLCSEGSSIRVKAQAQLRKYTTADLLKHGVQAVEGLTKEIKDQLAIREPIKFTVDTDFESETGGPRDPVKTGTSAYKKMDIDQKRDYLLNTVGLPEAVVEATLMKEMADDAGEEEHNENSDSNE